MSKIKYTFLFFLIFLPIIFLYFYGLSKTPIYLNQDEMMFGLNAHSIVKTGTDFYGNKLPFYFWHLGSLWATPIIVYVTSLFLKFLPFSEWSIRISSVFVGLTSIFGTSFLAGKIFKKKTYSLFGLIIAGITPALFINSRLLLDNIWPIPFVIFWLLALLIFIEKKNILALFIAGLSLGIGIHSYHAAKIQMPIYLAATLVYGFLAKWLNWRRALALLTGFLIPIIIFIPWLKVHPDTLLNQVSYINSIDKSVRVSEGIFGVFNLRRLKDVSLNYLSYFSPRILFLEGDRSLTHSTGRVGAFTFGAAFLIIFGITETLRRKSDWFSKLILFGFLTYPIAPALVDDPQRISRGLIVVPFAVILGVYGVYFFLNRGEKMFKYLLVGILAFSTLEFTIFINDYFGNYRVRSSSWFNGAIGPTFESVIKSTDLRKVERIYIDKNIPFSQLYFDFYQIKFSKNLNKETIYFDPKIQDFSKFPKGSVVAIGASDILGKPDKIGLFEKIEVIRELNGNESYFVYWCDK